MTILKYNNIEYNIVYIDPSIETAGDGSSCASALKTLPSPLVDETCYLIRRTTEEYLTDMQKSHNVGLRNIIFLGMPKQGSYFYDLIDEDTKADWGSDVAEYANIRMNSNAYNNSTSDTDYTNVVYYETNTENFIAENCYFFRDGEGASASSYVNMMFTFNQTTYKQNIRFDGCKFGYAQYDIDDPDFLANNTDISTNTSKYPQNKCQGYVGINYANNVSFVNCIINCVTSNFNNSERDSITHGCHKAIYIAYYCNNLEIKNCSINKLSREYLTSNQYIHSYFNGISYGKVFRSYNDEASSTNYYKRGNAYIHNITINQILCGSYPLSYPKVLSIYADNIEADNIKINLLNMKDCTTSSISEYVESSNPYQSSYMIVFGQAHGSIKVQNIEADFSNAIFQVPSMQTLAFWNICKNSLGTPSSYIRNINLKYAQEWDRLSTTSGNNYILDIRSLDQDYSNDYNNYYPSSRTSGNSTKSWIAENIVVDAPLNSSYSLYLNGVGVKSPKIRGRVYLWQSTLEVDELYNWYASQTGANVYGNSYLKVNNYTADLNNKIKPYIGNTQMEIQRNSRCSVYVNKTNSAIFNELVDTNVTKGDMNSICTCMNYIVDGQFMARNTYTFAKSWNVVRTGSNSNASIRFNNNSCVQSNRPHPLVIGLDPYKGIEITPTSLGKKMITCYIACKNFDDVELKLGQEYCGIDVYVPEKISEDIITRHRYTSTTNGWKEDNSTWSNDANLKTFKMEIPVEVKDLENPIEVKIWYNWYSTNGCVYVDPDIKMTDM